MQCVVDLKSYISGFCYSMNQPTLGVHLSAADSSAFGEVTCPNPVCGWSLTHVLTACFDHGLLCCLDDEDNEDDMFAENDTQPTTAAPAVPAATATAAVAAAASDGKHPAAAAQQASNNAINGFQQAAATSQSSDPDAQPEGLCEMPSFRTLVTPSAAAAMAAAPAAAAAGTADVSSRANQGTDVDGGDGGGGGAVDYSSWPIKELRRFLQERGQVGVVMLLGGRDPPGNLLIVMIDLPCCIGWFS